MQFDKMFPKGQTLPTLREFTDAYKTFVLQEMDGQKSAAARVLGINRRTLYRGKRNQGADRGEEPSAESGS